MIDELLDDHAREIGGIPRDDCEAAFGVLRRANPTLRHLGPHEHRRERGAKLVRERGEELILRATRRLGLAPRLELGSQQLLALCLDSFSRRDVVHEDHEVVDRAVRSRKPAHVDRRVDRHAIPTDEPRLVQMGILLARERTTR